MENYIADYPCTNCGEEVELSNGKRWHKQAGLCDVDCIRSTKTEKERDEALAKVSLLQKLVEVSGTVANRLAAELKEAQSTAPTDALRDAAEELLEVARLRGDNELPHPSDSDKLWTARMQEAWDVLEEILEPKEGLPHLP